MSGPTHEEHSAIMALQARQEQLSTEKVAYLKLLEALVTDTQDSFLHLFSAHHNLEEIDFRDVLHDFSSWTRRSETQQCSEILPLEGSEVDGESAWRDTGVRMPECNVADRERIGCLQTDQPSSSSDGAHLHLLSSRQTSSSSRGQSSSPIPHGVTTLIVCNVPAKYTKEMLMLEWPSNGAYNFIFVPYDFKQKRAAGRAFINFTSHDAALVFYFQWHGKLLSKHGSNCRLNIDAARMQGLEENLRYWRDRLRGVRNARHLPTVLSGVEVVPF